MAFALVDISDCFKGQELSRWLFPIPDYSLVRDGDAYAPDHVPYI